MPRRYLPGIAIDKGTAAPRHLPAARDACHQVWRFVVLGFTQTCRRIGKEIYVAIESMVVLGMAVAFLVGIAWYASRHRAEDATSASDHRMASSGDR